jgi:hypothetical protein
VSTPRLVAINHTDQLCREKLTPGVSDVEGSDLASVNRTGSWTLSSVDEDVVTASGQNASQPKTFYSTTENGASITHSFNSCMSYPSYLSSP